MAWSKAAASPVSVILVMRASKSPSATASHTAVAFWIADFESFEKTKDLKRLEVPEQSLLSQNNSLLDFEKRRHLVMSSSEAKLNYLPLPSPSKKLSKMSLLERQNYCLMKKERLLEFQRKKKEQIEK